MTIKDKYFPGTTVSRYLSPSEASWDSNVYQSGKPVLDSELNLEQEVGTGTTKYFATKRNLFWFLERSWG